MAVKKNSTKKNATADTKTDALVKAEDTTDVALMANFEEDAGDGASHSAEELSLPFLTVLQKNSPQVDEDLPEYIKGAKPGAILNTATGTLYDGKVGIEVIPCYHQRTFVEWIPRDDGGGFVAQHEPSSSVVLNATPGEKARSLKHGDNDLIETVYNFVLHPQPDGSAPWSVISMSSTQLKASRQWNTMIDSVRINGANGPFKPPRYAFKYRLTTALKTRDKYSWYTWQVERVGIVTDVSHYQTAKAYCQSVREGATRVSKPPSEDAANSNSTDNSTVTDADGEEVPF